MHGQPINRRTGLKFASAALIAGSTQAWGQGAGFQDKPIKVIVPSAPGGIADILTRLLAPKMAERLGRPVVADNRAGAAGTIGLSATARSAPDGHTLVFVSETHAAAESLYPERGYSIL